MVSDFHTFCMEDHNSKKFDNIFLSCKRYSTRDTELADGNFFGSIRNKNLKTCLFQVTRVRGNIEQ